MYQFVYDIPTRILFGAGQLQNLHKENLPGKKALIVTSNGTSVRKYGYLAQLEKELDEAGVSHVLFDQVRPNPNTENVMDGAALAKKSGCDFVVALGWRLGDGLLQVCRPDDDQRGRYLGLQPVRSRRKEGG